VRSHGNDGSRRVVTRAPTDQVAGRVDAHRKPRFREAAGEPGTPLKESRAE